MIVDGLIAVLAAVVTSLAAGNARDRTCAKASAAQRSNASQGTGGPGG